MRCSISSCKYYLHLACFRLPTQISFLPLLHRHDHSLQLQSGDNRIPWIRQRCNVCHEYTNGLYYVCTKCDGFRVDIKCASMPDTIYHAAHHPNHLLDLLSRDDARSLAYFKCDAGCDSSPVLNRAPYKCRSCDFTVHLKCAGLPESATSRRWDKHHQLHLTHDATRNRPGDFYCDQCEQQMNPRSWMYHCRSCDVSFHPDCLKTTCGEYRNIKIGQKYVIAGAHHHTLTYQLLTTKRKCNTCGEDKHERPGFYCALCNFFICFNCWFSDFWKYLLRPEADLTLLIEKIVFSPAHKTHTHKMSGKVENELEEEEEEEERKMLNHWHNEHPLSLVVIGRYYNCDGCTGTFRRGEKGYRCSQECLDDVILHEDCAEAPRKIRHAMHPQHTLTQQFSSPRDRETRCSICQDDLRRILYRCTSTECTFKAHIRCARGSDMMCAAEDEERSIIHHPSHPSHELKLLRRSCAFKCDACGTIGSSCSSYTCLDVDCQYWIHERCASLPRTVRREDHHHSLSLSFHVPPQYLKYNYRCEVCRKFLTSKHWIYHCELCSYAVHLTCAFTKYIPTMREQGIMQFPISDGVVGEDLIGAFLRRQGVDTHTTNSLILDHQDDVDYKFHHHKLRLVSSSSSSSFQEEENGDDDDDEEDYSCRKSELICDGCITPIRLKQTSSSSSSSFSGSKYMRCSIRSCKYYLHLACFRLPTQLPSLPLLHRHDHNLVLRSGDKHTPWKETFCSVCFIYTNGLYYTCAKCSRFRVDIKCASMPETIYHAAHPPHPLNLLSLQDLDRRGPTPTECDADCEHFICGIRSSYACSACDFVVHLRCAGLPTSSASCRWDKRHPLLLMHDATLNRPGEFYCDGCETIMNPRSWMYRCRSCDVSFHPGCLLTTTGRWRKIKFGQRYTAAGAHCHALTYQILTTKRRCNVCGEDQHEDRGFYCALCIFFICLGVHCGQKLIQDGKLEALD
ncbi:uncharacterized protein LOC125207008 [Salvia hispanica]|uniref:uncharacterized protein LOC125207008 n=1 Tax=Salvia hispanica TaxID=49212 RepID=UPI00200940A9|nr:uncharacterized protein LOC125207008 [Salvia hispanica]